MVDVPPEPGSMATRTGKRRRLRLRGTFGKWSGKAHVALALRPSVLGGRTCWATMADHYERSALRRDVESSERKNSTISKPQYALGVQVAMMLLQFPTEHMSGGTVQSRRQGDLKYCSVALISRI